MGGKKGETGNQTHACVQMSARDLLADVPNVTGVVEKNQAVRPGYRMETGSFFVPEEYVRYPEPVPYSIVKFNVRDIFTWLKRKPWVLP